MVFGCLIRPSERGMCRDCCNSRRKTIKKANFDGKIRGSILKIITIKPHFTAQQGTFVKH